VKLNLATSFAIGALSASLCSVAQAAPTARPVPPPMGTMHQTAPTPLSHPAHVTGQPNQSCGSATAPNTPGNAAAAPGSAFNPSGQAGTVYAGQQPQNSRNTASASQYDVACFHQR
jgi:hypothetical protein